MRKEFNIPIYNVRLCVVMGSGIKAALKEVADFFGDDVKEYEDFEQAGGLACWQKSSFAIAFTTTNFSVNVMAHEVFHTTHRILDWADANFDGQHHETAALLHGYLMDLVYKVTKRYIK